MKTTILVVEDDPVLSRCFFHRLSDKGITVLSATKIQEALDLFQDNLNCIDLIIMDACLEKGCPDTMPLIRKILEYGFKKPIIASSSDSDYSKILRQAGATHTAEKWEVTNFALELLKTL